MMDDKVTESLIQRLDILESKDQIRSVIERLPRSIDRCDADELLSAFWPEGKIATPMSPDPVHESMPRFYSEVLPSIFDETHHHIGSIIIELRGNEAFTETYVIAHHRTHPTPESNAAVVGAENIPEGGAHDVREVLLGFRYLDHFERRGGIWKILNRKLVADWSSTGTYSGFTTGGVADVAGLFGSRSKDDPSYSHLLRR